MVIFLHVQPDISFAIGFWVHTRPVRCSHISRYSIQPDATSQVQNQKSYTHNIIINILLFTNMVIFLHVQPDISFAIGFWVHTRPVRCSHISRYSIQPDATSQVQNQKSYTHNIIINILFIIHQNGHFFACPARYFIRHWLLGLHATRTL